MPRKIDLLAQGSLKNKTIPQEDGREESLLKWFNLHNLLGFILN